EVLGLHLLGRLALLLHHLLQRAHELLGVAPAEEVEAAAFHGIRLAVPCRFARLQLRAPRPRAAPPGSRRRTASPHRPRAPARGAVGRRPAGRGRRSSRSAAAARSWPRGLSPLPPPLRSPPARPSRGSRRAERGAGRGRRRRRSPPPPHTTRRAGPPRGRRSG